MKILNKNRQSLANYLSLNSHKVLKLLLWQISFQLPIRKKHRNKIIIIMIDIFSKDRKAWTSADQEQVELFFCCNQFFSKFYQHQYFEDIVQIAYYTKVNSNQTLYLTDNKRPKAVILLKGNASVFKRRNKTIRRKNPQEEETKIQEFIKIKQLLRPNDTVIQSSECKVTSLHGQQAQIIYVPSFLYNKLVLKIKEDKDRITFDILRKIFKNAENRYVMDLARSGCSVKQYKINNYIYQQGQKPQSVYVIIEGSVKIQRPGFSHRNFQFVVLSTESLLGEKDICFKQRESSAICCSANIRLLQIPKQSFLTFAKTCLPDLRFEQKLSSPKHSKIQSPKKSQEKLPIIMKFRQGRRSAQQLIKNSHVLLEASRSRKNRIKSRSRSQLSDYPTDIMKEKLKLFKKLRPMESKVDLTHRIL